MSRKETICGDARPIGEIKPSVFREAGSPPNPRAKKIIWLPDGKKEYSHDWDELGAHESPIETEMHRLVRGAFSPSTAVIPQYEIGPYRVDFAIKIENDKGVVILVVECDGEEFHRDFSKEIERERALKKLGVACIIRATGSDIYSRPAETLRRIKFVVDAYEGGFR